MKNLISITTVLFLLICTSISYAQDSTILISGRIQYDHISYFNQKDGKTNNRNEGFLQIELGKKYGKGSQWRSVTELREDMSDSKRNRIWIDELWMKQSVGFLDFSIGKQLISWGTTDGINPVNNINPIDYRDLLDTDDERIGVYGVRAQIFLNSSDFDIFWSLFPSTGKLPGLDSRWFPSPEMMGIPQELINAGIPISINESTPKMNLNDGEIGFRFRKRFSGFDFAASYYNGYDHLPEYIPDTTGLYSSEPTLIFRSSFHRQQVAGIELAIALPNGFGFRGESALFIPDSDVKNYNNYIQSAVGFDRSFIFSNSTLLAILQYVYDYNLGEEPYEPLDLRHIFKNSLMSNLEWNFNNGIEINLTSFYNFDKGDFILRPEFSYISPKGLRISVLTDIIEGESNTFFGSYSKNDRVQCKVSYSF